MYLRFRWLLFFVLTLPVAHADRPAPFVRDGVADLRREDLQGRKLVSLKGDWEFAFGIWATSNDVLEDRVSLPHRWVSSNLLPALGRATYRARLLLPPARGEPWAIGITEANVIHLPLRIYANGQLIHLGNAPREEKPLEYPNATGTGVGEPGEFLHPSLRTGWAALPPTNDILLEVFIENQVDVMGGRLDDFTLGTQSAILDRLQSRVNNKLFSLGTMALGFVIFLFFFLMMPSSVTSLYFALFCLSIMIRTVSIEDRIFEGAFPYISVATWNRGELLGYIATVLSFMFYVFSLFPEDGWKTVNRLFLVLTGASVALVAVLPPVYASGCLPPFQWLSIAFGPYCTVVLIRAARKNREGSVILLLGFLLIFLATVNDILYSNSWIHTGLLSQYAVSVFIMMLSVLLVYRHVRHIHQVRVSAQEALEAREALLTNRAELMQLETDRLYTDALTGLPNQARLESILRKGSAMGFAAVDFPEWESHDRFYGGPAAQGLLRAVASHLQAWATRAQAQVYKLPGARFYFHFPHPIDENGASPLAEAITQTALRPVPLGSVSIHLKPLVAVTQGSDQLFEKIEKALKDAENGPTRWAWCDHLNREDDHYRKNLEMTAELAGGLASKRLLLHYQPILDNKTLRFFKHEALVRLRTSQGAVLPPMAFLPVAKASNLYGAMTREVLELVQLKLASTDGDIGVNLSNRDLQDDQTWGLLSDFLDRTTAPRVVFEMLESDSMGDYQRVSQFIERAKARGCRIAIDDFGSGYSNFDHILRMNVDIIKIDGSLIRNLDRDDQAQILVGHIVDFSAKLGLETVAEYVHNGAIFEKVRAMGIHHSQGYHLGAPTEHGRFGETHDLP